ncbi:TRAP transporter substrate-binding protein [Deltaproteobacteria bacterium]|nr:TRAP transporter substrate-binding protein [Deltaproteobacteria bacterium]
MKKVHWRSILFVLMLFIYSALFYVSPGYAYSEDSPIVLKCAIDNPPGDMKAKTLKRMGDMIEAQTNGRIQFKYFYGGSLIKKSQFVDAVARGIADISTGPVSFVTGKIPELSIFEIYGGYKLDKYVEIQKAVWGPMKELFMPKGIYPLMFQYSGSAIFSHKSKFLKTPADWDGQRMRLAGRWQSTLGGKQWGASSIFMEPGDLYLALQRGVIEGYMLIWDIINGLKLYEVSPYIVDTGFSGNIEVVTMNLKKWKTLTDADRTIFLKVVAEVTCWTYDETLKHYENIRETLTAKGVKIHTLSAEEKSLYLKDVYALYPEIRKASGEIGNQFIDILEANDFRDK